MYEGDVKLLGDIFMYFAGNKTITIIKNTFS